MKHSESYAKKKELFMLMRLMKGKLYGEIKTANSQQQKTQAWLEVHNKAKELGLCKPWATVKQVKKNCVQNTIQKTREKLNQLNRTGQSRSGVTLTELDDIVLDVVGRGGGQGMTKVRGGRGLLGWGRASEDEQDAPTMQASDCVDVILSENHQPLARDESVSSTPSSTTEASSNNGTDSADASPANHRPQGQTPLPRASSTAAQTTPSRPRDERRAPRRRRRPSREEPIDRRAVAARYHALLALPDEERTDEERARVRDIVTLRILERMASKVNLTAADIGKIGTLM